MKLLHRLWLGPRPMPDRYVEYGVRWAQLNPDWQVLEWRAPIVEGVSWRNQAVLDDLKRRDDGRHGVELYVQMADVLGYEIVWKHGGVYVNCDIEPVRPLSLIEDRVGSMPWACYEDDEQIVNAAFGGEPKDPFWNAVIERLLGRYAERPGDEMNQTTGPCLLTEVWKRWAEPFVALPKETFNPVHWSQVPVGGTADGLFDLDQLPGTVGVHHWGHRIDRRTNYVETATQVAI